MSLSGSLQERIEHWFAQGAAAVRNGEAEASFFALREELEAGALRSAEPDASLPLGWRVNAWVKRGILLGFRLGQMVDMGCPHGLSFVDKATYPARRFSAGDGVRVVPGGVECEEWSLSGEGSGRDASRVRECGSLCG